MSQVWCEENLRSGLPILEELSSSPPHLSPLVPAPDVPGAAARLEPDRKRELYDCVHQLLSHGWHGRAALDRRLDYRAPFRKPLTITPLDSEHGGLLLESQFEGFGIEISPFGLGFLSRKLLAGRAAVVSCEAPGKAAVHLLFQPKWTRFTRGGWYQIGGQLLRRIHDFAELSSCPHGTRAVPGFTGCQGAGEGCSG